MAIAALVAAPISAANHPWMKSKKGKVTPENQEEGRKLLALWEAAKAAGKVGSQASFGADYGIGNQGAVWQYLHGETTLSKKAAAGFAKGLGCLIADFSPRLAAEIDVLGEASSGELRPAAKTALTFPRSGIVTIHVNLAVPEAAVLHRMVHAAGLPGVVVGVEKWKGSKGPQLGKFSTEGVPTAPAPPGLAVVKTARKQPAKKALNKKEEK